MKAKLTMLILAAVVTAMLAATSLREDSSARFPIIGLALFLAFKSGQLAESIEREDE